MNMRIVEWLGDRVAVEDIITLVAGAALLGLFQWLRRGAARARRRLLERREWYARLSKLRTDVARAYFEQELCLSHAFRTVIGRFTEHVYPHKWFFVQCLTDEHDNVVFYSVTSRDAEFTPAIWPSSASPDNVPAIPHERLGSVPFAEIFPDHVPNGVLAFFSGATAPSTYVESYYLGNPGLYLTYLIGLNDAGHYSFDMAAAYSPELVSPEVRIGRLGEFDGGGDSSEFLSRDYIVKFRRIAKPNTFGILGRRFPYSEALPVYLGPSRTQVRTL